MRGVGDRWCTDSTYGRRGFQDKNERKEYWGKERKPVETVTTGEGYEKEA